MTGFSERLKVADKLEGTFIAAFNERCTTHKVVKFGIEATNLASVHNLLRNRYDATSRFLRYLPDSLLVESGVDTPPHFVEFKSAQVGIRYSSFLDKLARQCPDIEPRFASKEDVFNIESEALNGYLELDKIDVSVIVVGHARFRDDDPVRAQYATRIAVCNEYNPNQGVGTTGSGTWIKNTNFASFVPLTEFLSGEFGIDSGVAAAIDAAVRAR